MRRLLSICDLEDGELERLLTLAGAEKARRRSGEHSTALQGHVLAMIFEKPSLRTRVTLEAGMAQLGGTSIYLAPQDIQLGVRESVADVAANLSRWVDIIAARVFAHEAVAGLAQHATVPVINSLSNLEHPCQALADLLTVQERFGGFGGVRLAYIGDGNNVTHSLMLGAARVGLDMTVATPPGYEPRPEVVEQATRFAAQTGARLELTNDPSAAARGAHALYTDVWASMGQESERDLRRAVFMPWQVNSRLLALADPEAIVLHCLPARRGEEITDEVLDGPHSAVLDQAENRLHVQKAVFLALFGG